MSYDFRRVTDIIQETVVKHGVIFVTSAGNDGPALSTIGAPASTADCLIGNTVEPASNWFGSN